MPESSFGKRLETKRKMKGYSQAQLAGQLGKKHRVTISSWETGKAEPSMSELQQLAEMLDTTVAHLVDGLPEGSGVPRGYTLVSEEDWNQRNQKLIELQEEVILYQKKEISRQRA